MNIGEVKSHYILKPDHADKVLRCLHCGEPATAWSQREGPGGRTMGTCVYHCRKPACWVEGRRVAGIARNTSRKKLHKIRQRLGITDEILRGLGLK